MKPTGIKFNRIENVVYYEYVQSHEPAEPVKWFDSMRGAMMYVKYLKKSEPYIKWKQKNVPFAAN